MSEQLEQKTEFEGIWYDERTEWVAKVWVGNNDRPYRFDGHDIGEVFFTIEEMQGVPESEISRIEVVRIKPAASGLQA